MSKSDSENQENKPIEEQKNNPMHGVKLVDVLEFLVDKFGWEELGYTKEQFSPIIDLDKI